MSIWEWAEYLPEVRSDSQMTLGEGNTPLLRSLRIGPSAGLDRLYFKLETTNPTGSYHDRFAAAAVSDMLERNISICLATSQRNTHLAMAAYCAAAGIACHIALCDLTPDVQLLQLQAYGAHVFRVRDYGRDAAVDEAVMAELIALTGTGRALLGISAYRYSPVGMTGVQTIAHELAAELPLGMDRVFCPVGGGGLLVAVAHGFGQLRDAGRVTKEPAIECVQPEGNNTVSGPLLAGCRHARTIERSSTRIRPLRVPENIDGDEAIRACRESGGTGHLVSDREVDDAQARLARDEGIFCEPAGAVALAGALRAVNEGTLSTGASTVCLVTGSGLAPLVPTTAEADCPRLDSPRDMARLVANG